jgi:hypothetical protein
VDLPFDHHGVPISDNMVNAIPPDLPNFADFGPRLCLLTEKQLHAVENEDGKGSESAIRSGFVPDSFQISTNPTIPVDTAHGSGILTARSLFATPCPQPLPNRSFGLICIQSEY